MRRFAMLCLFLVAGTAEALPREVHVAGHVLVRWKDGTRYPMALGSRLPIPGRSGARFERRLAGEGEVHLFHADDESAAGVARLLAMLAADPDVAWAEPDRVRRPNSAPVNDPLYTSQWGLPLVRLPQAWGRSRGSERVVVAVLDTGIIVHPDLDTRMLPGYDFISDRASAGDGNGRDADPTDVGTASPASSGRHGMHVAGIIGAHADNGIGIAGIDWSCGILPVRVLGIDGGRGADSDIADAIRWAAGLHVDGVPDNRHPAAVINMSFGGPGLSRTLQSAVDAAVARGAIIVASAGNDSEDTAGFAPAGLAHVIAVGAVVSSGLAADYSNRGARVDLMAPGGITEGTNGILSTLAAGDEGDTGYGYLAGTSQAAPHVAGVAALMRAIDSTLNADRARAMLRITADPSSRCAGGCGGGLLDADAALAAVEASCLDGHCDNAGTAVTLSGGCSAARRNALIRTGAPRFDGGGAGTGGIALLGLALVLRRRRG